MYESLILEIQWKEYLVTDTNFFFPEEKENFVCISLRESYHNPTQKTICLTINSSDPPRITAKPNDLISPNEFEQVTIRCEATGYPPPKVTWIKLQTNQKVGNGNTHMFHSIRRQDSGMYKCVAKNGVGRPAKAFVQIKVKCKFIKLIAIAKKI